MDVIVEPVNRSKVTLRDFQVNIRSEGMIYPSEYYEQVDLAM